MLKNDSWLREMRARSSCSRSCSKPSLSNEVRKGMDERGRGARATACSGGGRSPPGARGRRGDGPHQPLALGPAPPLSPRPQLTTDIGGPLLNGSKDIDTVACADNCLDLGVFASMVGGALAF